MKLLTLKDSMWRRHSNPLSAWTRLLSIPLAYIPFWYHSWLLGLLVILWFVVNPFLFPEPKNKKTWAAQAIQGERQWAKERPLGASMLIQTVGFIAFISGFYSAYLQMFWLTVVSAIVVFVCNVWFLDRMTDYANKLNYK